MAETDPPLDGDDVKELVRMRTKLDNVRGPGVFQTDTTITISPPRRAAPLHVERERFFFARIVAGNETDGYTFIEQVQDADGFRDLTDDEGRRTDVFPQSVASPMNDAEANGRTVVMFEHYDPSLNPPFTYRYLGLPTGQYQYQVYSMVAQNVGGWDFVRAHPMVGV